MATQFGLATIPFLMWWSWSAFTSGTTSGQSGSIRHADELSTTMAPAFAAIRENSLLTELGVLLRTICTPANASARIGSTGYVLPANVTVFPALFSEARNLIVLTGKFRSARTVRMRSPTAPVAPTTATFTATVAPPVRGTRPCGRNRQDTGEGRQGGGRRGAGIRGTFAGRRLRLRAVSCLLSPVSPLLVSRPRVWSCGSR